MTYFLRRCWLIISILLLTSVALAGCNFPGFQATPDVFATSAAATVAMRLTQAAGDSQITPSAQPTTPLPPPQPTTATPTETGLPLTPTISPTITVTEEPCDRAAYVKDVTIPDGTDLAPGDNFTKTWRLKNTGTCTWTSGYSLIFDHGDSMGGPASKQLTAGTVAPGQTADVSVDLTAPNTPGTYKGYWKLRNPSGVVFGIGSSGDVAFFVEIDVVQPTVTIELNHIIAECGSVRSGGSVSSVKNVGDTSGDESAQVFVSFDISGIPGDATITEVVTDFSPHDMLGDPFGDLGCLDLFKQNYGALDAGDYFGGVQSGRLIRWCSS
ncbi:MAG: hypothetical protein KAS19_10675, partial [Anaerolineales bacterium]|nr:hypothetical protein [Anaerolineales bacterium]